MIKCFITLCLVAQPHVCQPPLQIEPEDGRPITSPMECARGAFVHFSQERMAQSTPDGATVQLWFPKINSYLEGDGSDIVPTWVEREKARIRSAEPQIR